MYAIGISGLFFQINFRKRLAILEVYAIIVCEKISCRGMPSRGRRTPVCPAYRTNWKIRAILSQCLRWRMGNPPSGVPGRGAGDHRTGSMDWFGMTRI